MRSGFTFCVFFLLSIPSHGDGSKTPLHVNVLKTEFNKDLLTEDEKLRYVRHEKIVKQFLDNHHITYSLRNQSIPRAFKSLEKQDVLFFSLTRTPERENKYHWLLKMEESALWLVNIKGRKISSLSKAEIINGNFKTMCTYKSISCDYLKEYGFKAENIMEIAEHNPNKHLQLLARGRIDLMLVDRDLYLDYLKRREDEAYMLEYSTGYEIPINVYLVARKLSANVKKRLGIQ